MKILKKIRKPKIQFKMRRSAIVARILGLVLSVSVVASVLAVTVPLAFEYDVYNIVSGSMEPYIPVGSAVYLEKGGNPVFLREGEIAAFLIGNSIIIHRVKLNNPEEAFITTMGDANEEDDGKVKYENVYGKAVAIIPVLGVIMMLFQTVGGKVILCLLFASGIWLVWLSFQLSKKAREEIVQK